MRLDIYRRTEIGGKISYLAVPEGKQIPEEAINTDWETDTQAVELDDEADELENYAIEHPIEQISAKGYAITSLKNIASGH
ncbi:hypothetical protein BH11PSE11_BH11PSE11_05950 [soil metagenome]